MLTTCAYSVTWIRQSRYFTSYHSSKQGSDQRSPKRENKIRSSSVQYLMLKRGIVADLLSHSTVLYYCICSNQWLRILRPELLSVFKVETPERFTTLWSVSRTRRSPLWLKHTPVTVTKAKNLNEIEYQEGK